jgi:hypothetical protein
MKELVTWLLVALVVAVPVVIGLRSLRRRMFKADRTIYLAVVGLYAIRRRLEVAQFKSELRRDAIRLRRELWRELDEQDRRKT